MLAALLVACAPPPSEPTPADDDTAEIPEGAISSGDLVCEPADEETLAALDPGIFPQGRKPCREASFVPVLSVTDGDTITVELEPGWEMNIRVIGVDTPETWGEVECYGPEAKAFTTEVLSGRSVWISHDEGCWDPYDRLLAYVHLSNDIDCFFERLLLRGGYAETMTFSNTSSYAGRFSEDEDWAREHDEGQWSACP